MRLFKYSRPGLGLALTAMALIWLLAACGASQMPTVAGPAPSPIVASAPGLASATPLTSATGAVTSGGAGLAAGPAAGTAPTAQAVTAAAAGAATPTDSGPGRVSTLLMPSAVLSATASLPGWRAYTDPAAGYSLSLPPGVDFRAGVSTSGVYTARAQFTIPGVAGYQGLVVRVEPNPTGRGLEQVLAQLYQAANPGQPPSDLLAQTQAITLTGLSAVKIAGAGQDFAIVIPYGDKIYTLAPVHSMATAGVDPQALALFEQVLGTFRITR